jgi:membrane-bound serine protease (ClpP class)
MKGGTVRRVIFFFVLLASCAVPCSADVLKISVNDTVNPISAEYIARAIDAADKQHADALLIELRTPGGLLDSTREIIEHILKSKVPVIVYVTPSGGYAASAGFYILESADIAAMAPGTNAGAAHPVLGSGAAMDPVMKQKMENDAAAFMRSFSEKRGHDAQIAESAIRESKSFSADEALKDKLIDLIAKDQADLLHQLDGRTIKRFDGREQTLHLAGKPVHEMPMSLRQQLLDYLMSPSVVFILFSIGMLALYAEFNHPGAVIPGVVGFIFIFLALFSLNMLPTRYAAFALLVAAFIMFALEAKFQSHGVLTIGGIVLMVIGGLLLVDGPIPEMRVQLWAALSVSIPLGLISTFLMTIALRARRNKVVTGAQGIIGEIGLARTQLNPSGKVFVHGELWNAYSPAPIAAGEQIIVRAIRNLDLEVAPASASAAENAR